MKRMVSKIIGNVGFELFVIFCFVFTINNYIGHSDTKINADGIGYYDYLPSTFIYKDFYRREYKLEENPVLYERISQFGGYIHYNEYLINKYPAGTAVLQFPFFIVTWLFQDNIDDQSGYEPSFQEAIYYSAVFYLFLTLVLFKSILRNKLNNVSIFVLQLLMALATSITHYACNDAAYSHVYSLFVITAFLYFWHKYLSENRGRYFIMLLISLGLIIIIRPVNVLIILFIPFISGDWSHFVEAVKDVFTRKASLLVGILMFSLLILFQMYLWYSQTGSWIVYSYGDEGFNFLQPEIINVLFSYSKGLFVYTPILILVIPSLIVLIIKREYYSAAAWLLPMLVVLYVISSWWCWDYGSSYGMRPFVEYYSLFFILLGISIREISVALKIMFVAVAFVFIPINIIQTYQYKEYILLWGGTTKEDYWKVFLKTEETYKGWLWKQKLDLEKWFVKEKEIYLGDVNTNGEYSIILIENGSKEIPNFADVSVVELELSDSFSDLDQSYFILEINDTILGKSCYWHKFYLGMIAVEQRNHFHRGNITLEFEPVLEAEGKVISLSYYDFKKGKVLNDTKISFYSKAN